MPILEPNSLEYISRSAEQTRRIGMRLGALVNTRDVICLVGELGSGKTTFVQGFAAGWGSPDPVSSPTFVLVNLYRRPDSARLTHLDAFRLNGAAEAVELDLEAIMESGPLIVEWAERIKEALPRENLWVTLRWIRADQRDLVFSARGRRYQDLLGNFRQRVYGGR